MPSWFALFQLLTAAVASAIWYLFPGAGPWPLLVGLAPWGWRLARSGRPSGPAQDRPSSFAQGVVGRLTGFEVPLFLFVVTAAAAVWAAPDREVAWAKFWLIVGGVLVFYGFVGIGEEGTRNKEQGTRNRVQDGEMGAWVLAGFGAAIAVYSVINHDWDQFETKFVAIERLGRVLQRPLAWLPGRPLNPTVAGGVMALSLPFTAGLLWHHRGRRKGRQALALAALGLILFGLLLSVDRGSWLAVATTAGVAGLWLGLGRLVQQAERRWRLAVAILASVAVVLLAAVWLWPTFVPAALARLPGGSTLGRLTLYRDGLALARGYPFIGAGLGNYMMVYVTYQLLIHVGFTPHADNLFLDVAIEQGMVAVFILLSMWTVASAGAGLMLRRSRDRPGRRNKGALWAGVSLLALLAMAVQGVVDDALYSSAAVTLLFVPLAFTVPALRRAGWARRLNGGFAVLALLVALLVAVLPGGRAAWWANQGTVAQGRSELAIYSWPEWRLQGEVRRALDMEPIMTRYERALALDPTNFSANRRMGQIALSLGEYGEALDYLRRAYAAAPWDHATRQLYGEALIVNGQIDEGAALWATVNNGQNQLGARLFWYEYIGDQARLAAVRRALPE